MGEPTDRRRTILRAARETPSVAPKAALPPSSAPPLVRQQQAAPPSAEPPPPQDPLPAARPAPAPRLDSTALMAELDALDPAGWAALLAAGSPSLPEPGERVSGTVVRVERDTIFVDIGAKAEGTLDRHELSEVPVLGQVMTVFVVYADDRGVRLAHRLSGATALDALEDAHETGIPIEGRVETRNPGGFTVRIGNVSAFCPISQIARHPDPDLDSYIGKTLPFQVIELRDRSPVVSHRAIDEEEILAQAAKTWQRLAEGQEHEGIVTGVKDFGVFVEIDGVQGLVPKRELGWDAEASPPPRGARVRVRVIEVDREQQRATFSLKDPSSRPWNRVGSVFIEDGVYPARVTRLTDFGAFVELSPGLEGLVHISAIQADHVTHPSEVLSQGQEVQVRLLSIDHEQQRLQLSIRAVAEGAPRRADRGPASKPVKQAGGFGTFGDLLSGLNLPK